MNQLLNDVNADEESLEENSITNLVASALSGNVPAWNALHKRYQPLINNVCSRRRVFGADAEDISQIVWLRLFERLDSLRDPRALPGWIATVTNNEVVNFLKSSSRTQPADHSADSRFHLVNDVDHAENLIRHERRQAVRNGLDELGTEIRELLLMLHAESHISYQDISDRLGMPIGSIGPTRARALKKLRITGPIQAFVAA